METKTDYTLQDLLAIYDDRIRQINDTYRSGCYSQDIRYYLLHMLDYGIHDSLNEEWEPVDRDNEGSMSYQFYKALQNETPEYRTLIQSLLPTYMVDTAILLANDIMGGTK